MAGALTISTLNNDTGVLATQNGMTGIAKAWCSYNGLTQTIKSSFNVSSVTRNGSGNYTFNFTTAIGNANYAWAASAGLDNINQQNFVSSPTSVAMSTWKQSGSLQLQSVYANVSNDRDPADFSVSVFSS
jgi:hypothetical protein